MSENNLVENSKTKLSDLWRLEEKIKEDKELNNIIQILNNGSKYVAAKDNQKIVFYLNSNDLNNSDTVFLDMEYLPIANQIAN